MDLDISKISDIIQDLKLVFPDDIEKIKNEKFLVLERGLCGKLYAIHAYEHASRFDNKTIFGVAKFLYRNNKKILDMIFINNDILSNIDTLLPKYSIILSNNNNENVDNTLKNIKMVLLNLFNSFRFGDNIHNKINYFYLPLRKDINNIIL
ncbi:virion assembly protein [Brazilian porcupinepox virus 1]|nr:virion assembly protein [Brazilian porcupinepox virus 1]